MTTTYPLQAVQPPRGVRRVLFDSGYAISAFPIALVAFVLVVVDLSPVSYTHLTLPTKRIV